MTSRAPIRVLNCHDAEPGWPWIANLYEGEPALEWRSITTQRSPLISRLPGPHLGRLRTALEVRSILSRNQADLIVSHTPYTSYYVEAVGRALRRDVPHLAFAFNFTDIPEGFRLRAMRRAFRRIDCIMVYSRSERDLYSRIFGIPRERLVFVPWGVAPPIAEPEPRTIAGPYLAALGGEARDHATLCDAARRLPHLRFVFIVRPHTLSGMDVPPNVDVHINLPWETAWSFVAHAEASIVPLRSSETPNGHVTIVGAMHLGKAQVITDSIGIRDYAEDDKNALLVPPQDVASLTQAIERLADDPKLRERLGSAGKAFAAEHCTEPVTVEAFRAQVRRLVR